MADTGQDLFRLIIVYLFASAVFSLGGFFIAAQVPGYTGSLIAAIITTVLSFTVMWWALFRRRTTELMNQGKKIFAKDANLGRPRELELTDETYRCCTELEDVTVPWKSFHGWRSDKRVIVVYARDATMNRLPRRWFATEADYKALQAVLKHQLGPQTHVAAGSSLTTYILLQALR